MPPQRRKKWTEAEERTLIDKYNDMICDGSLAKMKTREKKYRPISLYLNSVHHLRDPIAYPWQWNWKDVSTKVQNMRHQYALVKQKIKKPESIGDSGGEEFDWVEGLSYWSNFLRYKEVFGDVGVVFGGGNDSAIILRSGNDENGGGFDGQFGNLGNAGDDDFVAGIDGVENGVLGLEFDYDGEGEENFKSSHGNNHLKEDTNDGFIYQDIEPTGSDTRKKRKAVKKRSWVFLAEQLRQLRELEAHFEQREGERERERQRRDNIRAEIEKERDRKWEEREKERETREKVRENSRKQRIQEWEAMERESDERERGRREEELMYETEWEDRINRRRSEWKKRMDETLSEHRIEMSQIQSRIIHEQQNLTGQLLGIVSQWTAQPTSLTDHNGASSHYLTQMMQNLHHVNGIVHGDTRVEGDNQEDQFIVDG